MAGLAGAYTHATVIPDEQAIAAVPADAVVVGADAITPRSIVNKVLTRAVVQAAADRGIPRFAVASSSKLVPVEIPVPEPFEATPIELFTVVATAAGPAEPVLVAARVAAIALHPALVMLAEMLVEEGEGGGPTDSPAI